ncbi:MAG: thiamine phosphate synthase [Candidatus Omnitrophica bacterium]|nr:thiamine phosphate synthase [Candidatus Omnitrophota bacterium]
MLLRKMSLNAARLYLILDRGVNSYEDLFEIAKKAIAADVDIIQLRDKRGSVQEILNFSKRVLGITKGRVPYIINDRVDLAMVSCSSGVHLGQDDVPLAEARKVMGKKILIGVSCQTFAHAQKAQDNGADYIGFGSVFKTLTKPGRQPLDTELLKRVFKDIRIPVFAIGGINLTNIVQLRNIGVDRIAVCRAVCKAENIEKAVKQFKVSVEREAVSR